MRLPSRAFVRSVIAAALCGAVACSGSSGPSGPDGASPTPTAEEVEPITGLTWADKQQHDLGDGLTAGPCPGGGGAPFRCVMRGDQEITAYELIRYPVKTIDALRNAAGTDVVLGLHVVAEDAYDSFEQDRQKGCGPGTTFEGPEITEQLVAGRDGLHWWFAMSRDGAVDEQVDTWGTVIAGELVLIRYAGYGKDSCLPPEGSAYDPAVLTRLRPTLAAAVAGATL
jgi:hypothetical protein